MNNTLVAYFSATGVTGKAAKKLAEITEADLFEIVPEVPYTREAWIGRIKRAEARWKWRIIVEAQDCRQSG